jgi:hypothetical protein
MWTYRNWHPEDAESYLMAFPWPEPGEVPNLPGQYFVPTEKARAEIQWFIDNFAGEDEEPWVKDMVELAKAVLEEVH